MTDLKDSKLCKIIDTIYIKRLKSIIQTPCGKFLIGIEGDSIFRYCLETKQKFRIAGLVKQWGCQDGTRDESRFDWPTSLTLSKDLKTLFVTDTWNRVIRAICVGTGVTTTFAGQFDVQQFVDGPKEKACFNFIKMIKLSPDGNTLYVADTNKLRTICIATGQVDTIGTVKTHILDFTLSPDSKHVIICYLNKVLKYNLETGKSEIILRYKGYLVCEISKDGILFISNILDKEIHFVNLDTNQIVDTITLSFEPFKITVSTNGKQLYIIDYDNGEIQVLNICTNFKTFTQSQLSKHSFLFQAVVKRISI
jgi:DNA-binding beta-propeller fold protein YncE